MFTLLPAYGRDYKSKEAVIADWDADKDFINSPGGYINKSDAEHYGIPTVRIRYSNKRKVVTIQVHKISCYALTAQHVEQHSETDVVEKLMDRRPAQEPLVKIGTRFSAEGGFARITKINRKGSNSVTCVDHRGSEFIVSHSDIEWAVSHGDSTRGAVNEQ